MINTLDLVSPIRSTLRHPRNHCEVDFALSNPHREPNLLSVFRVSRNAREVHAKFFRARRNDAKYPRSAQSELQQGITKHPEGARHEAQQSFQPFAKRQFHGWHIALRAEREMTAKCFGLFGNVSGWMPKGSWRSFGIIAGYPKRLPIQSAGGARTISGHF